MDRKTERQRHVPTKDEQESGRRQRAALRSKSCRELIQEAKLSATGAQVPLIEAKLAQMPEICRHGYLQAMKGHSRGAAMKAFCMECVGWNREEVRACTAAACPLYPYRPYK